MRFVVPARFLELGHHISPTCICLIRHAAWPSFCETADDQSERHRANTLSAILTWGQHPCCRHVPSGGDAGHTHAHSGQNRKSRPDLPITAPLHLPVFATSITGPQRSSIGELILSPPLWDLSVAAMAGVSTRPVRSAFDLSGRRRGGRRFLVVPRNCSGGGSGYPATESAAREKPTPPGEVTMNGEAHPQPGSWRARRGQSAVVATTGRAVWGGSCGLVLA